MGKRSPSPPAAPDPAATAAAQAAANKEAVYESARVNQINQNTPWGNYAYSGEIGSPDRTLTMTLNPAEQAQLDQQRALASGLGDIANQRLGYIESSPFTLDNVTQRYGTGDLDAARQQASDELYQRGARYMDPRFERQTADTQEYLRQQGIPVGSEAYNNAMGDLREQQELSYADLRSQAALGGTQEAQRLADLSGGLRSAEINDMLLERQQPMNELAAILTGTPAFQTPQQMTSTSYQMAPADVMGAINANYQGQLNNYNQQVASRNNMLGGGLGLVGSLGSAAIRAWPF